ncbi:hypothetical protein GA0116948_101526 [Chitinophaga costaii]|uniref:Uncharacterized protein n=1 Tax=Chitinophaga costaii TaxID=1335309 RepID=A0A1C3ZSF7_9BACT|nr:hypothetical protein GA0116948_101526 [Chitinophaga costaii]
MTVFLQLLGQEERRYDIKPAMEVWKGKAV